MKFTAEQAVTAGAVWLDTTYPGWVDSIDLATLDLSKCHVCVLGQVWNRHIPTGERDELFSQVLKRSAHALPRDRDNGYLVIQALNDFVPGRSSDRLARMGFFATLCLDLHDEQERGGQRYDENGYPVCDCFPTYAELLDAWTLLILRRRIAAHPDLAELGSDINEIEKEKVTA